MCFFFIRGVLTKKGEVIITSNAAASDTQNNHKNVV